MQPNSTQANSNPLSHQKNALNHNKIGELDTLTVSGEGYRAVVLLQGAQLIHFLTDSGQKLAGDETDTQASVTQTSKENDYGDNLFNNWLWLSDKAGFNLGESVRGGVPICWPVFGQFDANPEKVQNSFKSCSLDLSQHGYARTQLFQLDSFQVFEEDETAENTSPASTELVLKLQASDCSHDVADLDLKVKFNFSQQGFSITLITQNNSRDTVHFSQALHTYLPTADITKTKISGFDGVTYSDTLTTDSQHGGWQTITQQGDIDFAGEVDRIYHAAPDITLTTPSKTYQLHAQGSNSTVIWNPWVEKSKHISQFADDDYQHMLCIETANAHLDVIELGAGEAWEMGVRVQRS